MKRRFGFKLIAALLIYANLLPPALLLAETTKPAGVVSALKGEVLITRAALPQQPASLKFKDDVFFRDRISTKEQSLVRVLMGGKALITVRELSDLTITEEPGKPSLVDLAKGKIGLAVARARMSPGESIEVRTPNAVAAVRGTVIVVEVIPVAGSAETIPDYQPVRTAFTGQATPVQAPSFITNFHVLKGNIDVTSLAAPGSPPVNIGAGMSVSVVGGNVGQPQTSPPVQQLVKGLAPPTQHIGTPSETNQTIANQQMATASNLASIITGVPTTVYTTTPQNLTSPDNKTTSASGSGNPQSSPPSQAPPPPTVPPPPSPTVPLPSALGMPLVTFSGFSPSITLNAPLGLVEHGDATLAPTSQSFPNATVPAPDVTVNPIGTGGSPGVIETPYHAMALVTSNDNGVTVLRETVVLSGGIGLTNSHVVDGEGGDVFKVSGADAVITGSALILQNSSINTSHNIIDITSAGVSCGALCGIISGGSLTGIASNALVTLDRGSSITANRLVSVDGEGDDNGLVLVGPALTSNGGLVHVTDSLISVSNGFLGVASALPLVALSNSSLDLSASSLLSIQFSNSVDEDGTVHKGVVLGGSALLAQNGSSVMTTGDLITVKNSLFRADSALPLVSVDSSTLSSRTVLHVNSGTVNLGGALLSATNNSTVTVGNNGLLRIDCCPTVSIAGNILEASGGGALVTPPAAIQISDDGGTHNLASGSGKAMFNLSGTATTVDNDFESDPHASGLTVGTDRPIRGTGVCPACPLASALIDANSTTVNTNQVVKIDTALLEATAPIINLGNSTMTSNSDLVNLASQAKLVGTVPGDALIKLSASTLTINNGSLFNVAGGSFLKVTGNLVSLTNSSTLNINGGWLVNVTGGSVFSLTGGSLGTFGASGTNTLSITNNTALCGGCSITTSIPNFSYPVLLANGALATNVVVNAGFAPFAGLSASNKVNISGASSAVLALNGATSKVKLGP